MYRLGMDPSANINENISCSATQLVQEPSLWQDPEILGGQLVTGGKSLRAAALSRFSVG